MSNNPGGGDKKKLFFSLSSYNRFVRGRSRRLESLPSSSSSSSSPNPIRFRFSDISSALKESGVRLSELWHGSILRCTLRNEKVIIVCRRDKQLSPRGLDYIHLSSLTSRSHHPALIKLLGASQPRYSRLLYLVYEDIPGATLSECLPKLSNWIWRMQVALDVARGLDYIHHHCGMVHNWLTSSDVIVTQPNSNACICLFGANDFRHGSQLAPEVIRDVPITQKSDVYAFGVVILELISGKSKIEIRGHEFVNLLETVRETICRGDHHEYSELDEETRRGRVMLLVDPQLHGSFPVDTAESLIRVALQCVEDDPSARPEMASVAGDIQRL